MIEDIYIDMLKNFGVTLKMTSMYNDDKTIGYMTSCEKDVVYVDKLKEVFVESIGGGEFPKSCDALYMTIKKDLFLIEFKNGVIDGKVNAGIKMKALESLLMLLEKFSETINFTRNNMNFILVYNEDKKHGAKQFEDIGTEQEQGKHAGINLIEQPLFKLAKERKIRFGLRRFKKIYFKDVFTYSIKEFEEEFVSKYCVD